MLSSRAIAVYLYISTRAPKATSAPSGIDDRSIGSHHRRFQKDFQPIGDFLDPVESVARYKRGRHPPFSQCFP